MKLCFYLPAQGRNVSHKVGDFVRTALEEGQATLHIYRGRLFDDSPRDIADFNQIAATLLLSPLYNSGNQRVLVKALRDPDAASNPLDIGAVGRPSIAEAHPPQPVTAPAPPDPPLDPELARRLDEHRPVAQASPPVGKTGVTPVSKAASVPQSRVAKTPKRPAAVKASGTLEDEVKPPTPPRTGGLQPPTVAASAKGAKKNPPLLHKPPKSKPKAA